MNAPSQVAVISLGLTKGGKRQGALESATLGVEGVLMSFETPVEMEEKV